MLSREIRQLIKSLDKERSYKRTPQERKSEAHGGSLVSFYTVEGAEITRVGDEKEEKIPLQIVVTSPPNFAKSVAQGDPFAAARGTRIKDTCALLLDQQVPTDFIPADLSVDEETAERTSVQMEQNLYTFLDVKEVKTWPVEDIRKLVGQLVEAYTDLHTRNIVHRDGTPANILITRNPLQVRLIDLEFATEVKGDGTSLHPNIDIPKQRDYENPNLPKDFPEYGQSNLKTLSDGYIFYKTLQGGGKTHRTPKHGNPDSFYGIRHLIDDKDSGAKFQLDCLIADLKEANYDIQKIREHEFFGETPEVRQQFFAELRTSARKQQLIIDGFPVARVKANDHFYLIQKKFKPVYRLAHDIADHLDQIEKHQALIELEDISNLIPQLETQLAKLTAFEESKTDNYVHAIQEKTTTIIDGIKAWKAETEIALDNLRQNEFKDLSSKKDSIEKQNIITELAKFKIILEKHRIEKGDNDPLFLASEEAFWQEYRLAKQLLQKSTVTANELTSFNTVVNNTIKVIVDPLDANHSAALIQSYQNSPCKKIISGWKILGATLLCVLGAAVIVAGVAGALHTGTTSFWAGLKIGMYCFGAAAAIVGIAWSGHQIRQSTGVRRSIFKVALQAHEMQEKAEEEKQRNDPFNNLQ